MGYSMSRQPAHVLGYGRAFHRTTKILTSLSGSKDQQQVAALIPPPPPLTTKLPIYRHTMS